MGLSQNSDFTTELEHLKEANTVVLFPYSGYEGLYDDFRRIRDSISLDEVKPMLQSENANLVVYGLEVLCSSFHDSLYKYVEPIFCNAADLRSFNLKRSVVSVERVLLKKYAYERIIRLLREQNDCELCDVIDECVGEQRLNSHRVEDYFAIRSPHLRFYQLVKRIAYSDTTMNSIIGLSRYRKESDVEYFSRLLASEKHLTKGVYAAVFFPHIEFEGDLKRIFCAVVKENSQNDYFLLKLLYLSLVQFESPDVKQLFRDALKKARLMQKAEHTILLTSAIEMFPTGYFDEVIIDRKRELYQDRIDEEVIDSKRLLYPICNCEKND